MFYILHLKCLFFCLHRFQRKHCIFKSIAYKLQNGQNIKEIRNKLKTVRSELKLRESLCSARQRDCRGDGTPAMTLGHSLGRSTPWRLRLVGAPPRLALLCALIWRGGGSAGRGGDGRGRGGGADPVGGADGAVLNGLALGAARDGHLLAALIFVGNCNDVRKKKKTEKKGVWGAAVFILPDTLQKAWASCVTQA